MIKAIIFDCFGVVVSDSLSVLCSQKLAAKPKAVAEIWQLIDLTNKGLMTPDQSSTRIAELFGMTMVEYRQVLSKGEIKDLELLQYVRVLRQTYKTAMLSNVGAGSLARRFDNGELERYFDVVVASGEIGFAKPEATAYEITADRLSVRLDECVFTDDREEYIRGGEAVGMQTILYKNFAQLRAELELLLSQS